MHTSVEKKCTARETWLRGIEFIAAISSLDDGSGEK
jgi:hypothetical protein